MRAKETQAASEASSSYSLFSSLVRFRTSANRTHLFSPDTGPLPAHTSDQNHTPHPGSLNAAITGGHSLDFMGGLSSSPSAPPVSTWTSRWVRRRTLELKMAARLLQRRAASEFSRYSLSSQASGLEGDDDSGEETQVRFWF